MMTEQSVQEVRTRAARYPYEDGVMEIGLGAVYTILGLLVGLFAILRSGLDGKWWYVIGVLLFGFASAALVASFVARYKRRVTFPRTGQVRYERPARLELRDTVIMLIGALAIAAAAIWLDEWYASIPAILGATLWLILFFTGLRSSLTRMMVVALIPLAVGLLAGYLGLDEILGSAYALAGGGLAMLATGLVAMKRYLDQYPEVDVEAV